MLANDWSLNSQLDLSAATLTIDSSCGGDGDVHQIMPNLFLPTFGAFDLLFSKRQNGANTQFTVGTGYNPNFVDTFGASVNTWRMFYSQGTGNNQFNVQAFPTTKAAGLNQGGKPVDASSGFVYSATAENGLLLVDFDAITDATTNGTLAEGTYRGTTGDIQINQAWQNKTFRVYDYHTQHTTCLLYTSPSPRDS